MRLIDADAVVEKVTRKANSGQWSEEVVYGIMKALYLVKSAQTIERPHGEWIDHSDEGYVECPFCGHATTCEDNIDDLHYCFFCGAKMRKEGESE